MAFQFRDYIFKLFPYYFKANDSYKDSNGEGLLERFCRVFGVEIDNEIYPKIKDYLRIVDPTDFSQDPKYLENIGYTLGNPPDPYLDETKYRQLLTFIINLYNIKGTLASYNQFFALLALIVQVVEHPSIDRLYDEGLQYDTPLDSEENDITYDLFCEICAEYSLVYVNPNDDCKTQTYYDLDPVLFNKLIQVISFIEPIDAKLRRLLRRYEVCEDYTIEIEELVRICLYDPGIYDNAGTIYDEDTGSTIYDGQSGITCTNHVTTGGDFDNSYNNSFTL